MIAHKQIADIHIFHGALRRVRRIACGRCLYPDTHTVRTDNLASGICRDGRASAGLYLVLGLLGLPVFTLGGGLGYVFQPTFGYIIGFVFGAYLAGLTVEKSIKGTNATYFLASLAGLAAIYVSGLIYVLLIQRFSIHAQTDMWALMKYYVLIPLPSDLILCAGTAVLAKRLRPVTKKYVELKKAVD